MYVDWRDQSMPARPTRETAARIEEEIRRATFFLLLATANSMASRWCPWEIGYADGVKQLDMILVVPTTTGATAYGNEYLELYRHIDLASTGRLAAWRPGEPTAGIYLQSL